jgi:hypothetical protein
MDTVLADTKVHTIHIFVDVSKTDHRKVDFNTDRVTGLQIKQGAKVPVEDDLAQRRHGQLELVQNDETVTITEGEHFVALPPGTIS